MAYIVPGCSCGFADPQLCAVHGSFFGPSTDTRPPGVAEVEALNHRHRWVYDGQQQYTGALIYHCDEHDPPLVRVVPRP